MGKDFANAVKICMKTFNVTEDTAVNVISYIENKSKIKSGFEHTVNAGKSGKALKNVLSKISSNQKRE